MKESYGEGVAIHTGPELCVVSRKAGHEALAGERAGRVLSPEISGNGVPTQSPYAEGHILSIDTQDGQEPHGVGRPRACTETPRARTGRSQVSSISSSGRLRERSGKSTDARR
jgi:RNA-directed DNA polymerase